jgi:glycolate oxidase FAD binding subunit
MVAGLKPTWVVAPSTVEALTTVMTACADQSLTVVTRGEGTKLDWGPAPTGVDVLIETDRLAGVHIHYADDLVVTVGAGTPLRAVQAALSGSRQRLAIDPGSAGATIGGVLATGEAGPLRFAHGMPRDQLLGIEFVRADGTLARSGGRVVKNVAGYDLGKLLCGSYGTLGIITSATFRTQPIPTARAWVSCTVSTAAEMRDVVDVVTRSSLAPAAIEADLPAVPNAPVIPHQRVTSKLTGLGTVAILLEGSTPGVRARGEALIELLGADTSAAEQPPSWWGVYPFGRNQVAVKMAAPPADLHSAIYSLRDVVGTAVPVRGSAGVGVCFAGLPATVDQGPAIEAIRRELTSRGGSCVVLNAPLSARGSLDMWGPVSGLHLMNAVKDRFDPDHRLAPGRFVGGI